MDTREDDSTSASSSSSTEEEYLMVTNRSRRERKEIKYNFDEFDDLIKSAIKSEDAVTEYKRKHKNYLWRHNTSAVVDRQAYTCMLGICAVAISWIEVRLLKSCSSFLFTYFV